MVSTTQAGVVKLRQNTEAQDKQVSGLPDRLVEST